MEIAFGGLAATATSTVASTSVMDRPAGIAVDATNVYWADMGTGALVAMPLGGGTVTTLATGLGSPQVIAVDGSSIYWANHNPPPTAVMSLPLAGGLPTTLALVQDYIQDIAVDATSVYWVELGSMSSSTGSVMKMPLTGALDGGALTTLASAQSAPVSLAVDATSVYWVNFGVNGMGSDGSVMKTSK